MNKVKIINGIGIGFAVMTFVLLLPFLFPIYIATVVFYVADNTKLTDLAQAGFVCMITLLILFQIGWLTFLLMSGA